MSSAEDSEEVDIIINNVVTDVINVDVGNGLEEKSPGRAPNLGQQRRQMNPRPYAHAEFPRSTGPK